MEVMALLIALGILVILSFSGISMLIVAPFTVAVLALLSGDMPILTALTGPFMTSTMNYVRDFFLIFLGGALFGKIMGQTGAARSLALFIAQKLGKERAMLAVVLATAVLTYGGVSLFVAVFAIFPLAKALFAEADIPKRLIPGAIALGAFTFTMTALPGTPQSINALPTNILGTTIFAAPILGTIGAIIIFGVGMLWLNMRVRQAKKLGEGYGETIENLAVNPNEKSMSVVLAILPLVTIFLVNLALTFLFKQASVVAYFAPFGGVNNTWSLILALLVGILLSLFLYRKEIGGRSALLHLVNQGAESSLSPIFNTALIIGFGGVVRQTAAFALFRDAVMGLAIPGLYKVAIASSAIAGITGSSSGGAGIALEALGSEFLAMGIDPQAIHRVMLVSAGGLDSLPHCGAVVTLLAVCGVSSRKGYLDVGVTTVVGPVLASLTMIIVYNTFGIV
ncbi:GntP family permease [Entomospira culicis]|uniref:GntP family permease n=1 Tax=Entomospira culicis TaxID=2719989 RepID=A0A968GEN1_9SPIO|nr:GntP family permease [Entomospira culicis]NIZ18991.1 GntP family permease [Entomospira culicis]NIZ69206.1 GntP family permease [Entomospira culicis]WDI37792.1 GntP family permease [Entomospira culicis]WDI39420.1 GntP family permease [Entomospira culicis]